MSELNIIDSVTVTSLTRLCIVQMLLVNVKGSNRAPSVLLLFAVVCVVILAILTSEERKAEQSEDPELGLLARVSSARLLLFGLLLLFAT